MDGTPVACSLGPDAAPDRLSAWHRILERVVAGREDVADGVRLELREDPEAVGELLALARTEQACCPFLEFRMEVAAERLVLEIAGPPGAGAVIGALVGGPAQPGGADGDPSDGGPPETDPVRSG